MPIGTGYVDVADGRLYYSRRGSGAPVLLMHPLALSGAVWGEFGDRLAKRFDVIALDARGHGNSTWSGRPFTVADLADDAWAVIDALGLAAVGVVGMSMGGSIALHLAAAHPERVGRLFLADTTAWYGADAPRTWSERADRVLAQPRPEQVPFQVDRWFTPSFPGRHPTVVRSVVRLFLATDSAVHASACRALGAMDTRPHLGAITAPTVVVTGQQDYATPPEMAEAIVHGVPNARADVLPGLRHLSLIERPELAELVMAHLLGAEAE